MLNHFLFVGGLLVAAIVTSFLVEALQIEVLVDAEWPLAVAYGASCFFTLWALSASFELLKLAYSIAILSLSAGAR